MVVRGGKKAAAPSERIVQVTMNLKSEGDKAIGTVETGGKKRGSAAKIVDGRVTGNSFSFTTVAKTKKGEQRQEWRGTVDGNTMKGTRSRPGAKRGTEFTAKRA
jgi:hypothetical protein